MENEEKVREVFVKGIFLVNYAGWHITCSVAGG